jgi:hypothetical protein
VSLFIHCDRCGEVGYIADGVSFRQQEDHGLGLSFPPPIMSPSMFSSRARSRFEPAAHDRLEVQRARLIAELYRPSPFRWRAYRLLLKGLVMLRRLQNSQSTA